MVIKGRLKEFSGIICYPVQYNQNMYFLESDRIWYFNSALGYHLFFEDDYVGEFQFFEGNLWITTQQGKKKKTTIYRCHDSKYPEKILKNDKFPYATAIKVSENYIAHGCEGEDFYLYAKRKRNKNFIKKKIKYYDIVIDESGIYAKSVFGEIQHLDFDLNVIWQKQYEKKNDIRAFSDPKIYQDIVIFNNGADPSTKENGEVIAYLKTDGQEVWKRTFEKEPANCHLYGDRLYMAHQSRMVILEAATGKTIVDEPSGFESKIVSEILVPLDDHLVMVSKEACAIRLFSGDGKNLIQHLDIPGGYETHDGGPLMIHDGKIFLRTYPSDMCLSGVKEGLLILEWAPKGDNGGIEIEPWPVSLDIQREKDTGGDFFYIINMQGSSLQDLLIYSEIALEELPSIYGAQIWSDERRDKKFNGRILFRPGGIEWTDEARRKIEAKARFVEKWCAKFDIFAGNGPNPITIEVDIQDQP